MPMLSNMTQMPGDFNMEYLGVDLTSFGPYEPALSYLTQNYSTTDQAFEFHGNNSVLKDRASEMLPPLGQIASTHNYVSHSFDPSPALCTSQPQNFPPFNETKDTTARSAPSMGPPTRTRKRKAPTLHADDWEPYKARIIELHIERDPPFPLRKVKDIIETEFGFAAE
jgi:hypothetical protein